MLQEHIHEKTSVKIKAFLLSCLDALLARKGFVAYIPIIFVTFSLFSGSSWQIFLTNTDVARYQCYALTFWMGSSATLLLPASQCSFLQITHIQPPFHLLPIEYPPLTLLPFTLALIAPLAYYQLAFALLMSLVALLIYWLLLCYGPKGAGAIFALYIFIGAVGTAQTRFDLLPTTLTLLALIAAERRHWTAAYVALAFGFLLKLYPLLLLPAFILVEQEAEGRCQVFSGQVTRQTFFSHLSSTIRGMRGWHWKNTLIFMGIILGVTSLFALFNVQGAVISQLSYFVHRPIQVEASGSTLLWLGSKLGFPFQITYTFGSLNIVSSLGNIVALCGEAFFVLGYGYTIWKLWRGRLDLTQASIALLLVFIATGKVFSPQYLIWLAPLLAYAGACDAFWLLFWGSVSALTTFTFIALYGQPVDPLQIPTVPGFFQTLAVRNLLFILLTVAYLFNWFDARRRRQLPPLVTGKETRHLQR